MTTPDKCPFCGAERWHTFENGIHGYFCGSTSANQADLCKEKKARQKAEEALAEVEVKYTAFKIHPDAVVAENQKLRELLEWAIDCINYPDFFHVMKKLDQNTTSFPNDLKAIQN